jgi:type I restriction enzyme S subunit
VDRVDNYLFDGEYLLIAEDGENLRTRNTPIAFLVNGKFWVNNHAHIVRGNHKADTRYLMYALSNLDISGYLTGSTMPKLTQGNMNRISLSVPPLSEQRAIAHILGTLDDKIELNRRMNQTLEAMARAIFKDWFVDFGPVRAKMEEREPYLPPEIWGLFPDALDEEGKPVGWQTYTLSDLAHHHRATVSPSAEPDRIFEHYSIPAYDAANEPSLDSGGSIKSNKTIVVEGAVLLSKLNPEIERVWLPNPKRQALQVASTEFLALTPLPPATRSILYCLFRSPDLRGEMAAMVTGTSKSHQRVPPKALLARELLIADPQLLGSFDQMVLPFFDRLLSNRREARTLAQTRDLLLPKLMSGGMRPPDVERVVKAVA